MPVFIENQPYELFYDFSSHIYEERCCLLAFDKSVIITQNVIDKQYIVSLNKLGLCTDTSFLSLGNGYNDLTEAVLNNISKIKSFLETSKHDGILFAFIPDQTMLVIAEMLGLQLIGSTLYCNFYRKQDLIKLSKTVNLPIISSQVVNETNISRLFKKGEENIIKADDTTSGTGVKSFSNQDDAINFLKTYNHDCIFYIQPKLNPQKEGSIQFVKTKQRVDIFICETMNENNSYFGFEYPFRISSSLVKQLNSYACNLYETLIEKMGFSYEMLGIDFIIADNNIFFHDLNPRKTAVNIVIKFVKGVIREFTAEKTEIISRYYNCHDLHNYTQIHNMIEEFNIPLLSIDGEGVFVCNPSFLQIGKIQVISVSNTNRAKEYLTCFEHKVLCI
ncbi:hypothetical protein AGMMS50268_34260 [Spirochaetia bacterium]|nr:hypothetical protein AGMMS50268_34260 [Spirochaetia bacterium]